MSQSTTNYDLTKNEITDPLNLAIVNNQNTTMDVIDTELKKAQDHRESVNSHPSQNISYSGTMTGITQVKSAIDSLQTQITAITVGAGTSPAEVVAAREGLDSTVYATLKNRLDTDESNLNNITKANSISDIQAKTYSVGDKIYSTLYGGSWWEVKSSVTMEEITISFDDELHLEVNKVGGGTAWAECQINTIKPYLQQMVTSKYIETMTKLKRRQSVTIACKGDSITYGQGGSNNLSGTPTGFGDGSVYDSNPQVDTPYPAALEAALESVYGADLTVKNHGYPGDRVSTSYSHHRADPGTTLEIILLGVNDMLYCTGNGTVPANILNDANNYNLQKFISAYRKYIAREIIRGNAIILLNQFKFSGIVGYDGTTFSAAKIMQYYRNAIFALGKEFNIPVVDLEDILGNRTGTLLHPTEANLDVMAKRIASLLIGNGYMYADKISGERDITGVLFGENLLYDGADGESKVGTENVQSFQYGFTASNISYDCLISVGSSVYYSFFLEQDYSCCIPICVLPPSAETVFELDFGIAQPEYKLDILREQNTNDRIYPLGSITLTTSGSSVKYNNPTDFTAPIVIQGRGWHTIRITANTNYCTFMGFRFFSYNGYYLENNKTSITNLQSDVGTWVTATLEPGIGTYNNNTVQYNLVDGVIKLRGTVVNTTYSVDTKLFELPENLNVHAKNANVALTSNGTHVRIKYNSADHAIYWLANDVSASTTNLCNLACFEIYRLYV